MAVDNERTIRLRIAADFREARRGVDQLRAEQARLHSDAVRQDDELTRRERARADRNSAEAATLSARTKLLDRMFQSRLDNARVESAAARERTLDAQRDLKSQEDLRKSILNTNTALTQLKNSSKAQDRELAVTLKTELDERLLRDELRRMQTEVTKSRPRVVVETVLDKVGIGRVKRQIEELKRERIEIEAQINIHQDRRKVVAAAVAAGRSPSSALDEHDNAGEGLTRKLKGVEDSLSSLTAKTGEAAEGLNGFAGKWGMVARFALPALAAIVGALGPLIGELLQAGGAVIGMAGAFAGAAVVVGVGLVTAFQNSMEAAKQYSAAQKELTKAADEGKTAMQLYQDQLNSMTPAGKEFTEFLTGSVMPAFDTLKSVSESSFLPGITEGWQKLMGYVSQFQGLVTSAGESIGDMVDGLATFLTEGAGVDDMNELFQGIQETIAAMAPGFEQFGEAIMTIFGQGASSASTFAETFTEVMTNFNEWIQGLANNGELQEFFEKGEKYLEDFLGLIGDIGSLITAAFSGFTEGDSDDGSMLSFLRKGIQGLRDILGLFSENTIIMNGLKTIGAAVFGALYAVIVGVVSVVAALGAAMGLVLKTYEKLAHLIGLGGAFEWLAKKVGISTDESKKQNEELERTNALLKEQSQIDVGGGKTELKEDYLKSIAEGGTRFTEMKAALVSTNDATKDYTKSQEAAAKAAKDFDEKTAKLAESVKKAERAQRDAREDLTKTIEQNKRALEEDRKNITERVKDEQEARDDLKRTQRDNARSIVDAEDRAAKAHLNTLKAQEAVNKARREALDDLIKLRKEVERGSLNEQKGALALRQAQQAYYRIMHDSSATFEDREAARLDVAEKQADFGDTVDTNRQNRIDLNKANQKGVEGSDKVKDAVQNRIDAEKDEKKAVEDVTKAREDAQRSEKKAEEAITKAVEATRKARQKLSDDTLQFSRDERSAREKVTDAEKAYTQALKDQGKQLETLRAQKKAALDDVGIKKEGLKDQLMSQSFAGYSATGANKTMSGKDAEEYIKLLNGLDPSIRTALQDMGLPNNLAGMKTMAADIAKLKKSQPKLTGRAIVQGVIDRSFSNGTPGVPGGPKATPEQLYDPATKRYIPNPAFTGTGKGPILGPKLSDVVPKATQATTKELKETGTKSGAAFGEGLNAGIVSIKPDIKTELRESIWGPDSKDSAVGSFKDGLEIKSPSKVFQRFGGAMGAGLNDGLVQSVATIQKTMDDYYTGTGGQAIRGIFSTAFEMKSGRSDWFFKFAGALMVGVKDGILNSVRTIADAIKVMTDTIFKGFQGPLDLVGDLFSAMMDEGNHNLAVGANTMLGTMRSFLAELNKISSEFDINLTPDVLKDLAVPALRTPANVSAKAQGGFAGGPDQGTFQRYDSGGKITGSGGGTEDKVHIRVSPREWIQPEHSVNYYGDNVMEAIRTRRIPREDLQKYAVGGSPSMEATYEQGHPRFEDDDVERFAAGGKTKKKLGASWQEIVNLAKRSGAKKAIATSTTGGKHAKGSYHYQGQAVDFGVNTNGKSNVEKIAKFFFTNFGSKLSELIFARNSKNLSDGYYIKDGKKHAPYGPASAHLNHVHIAAKPGFSTNSGVIKTPASGDVTKVKLQDFAATDSPYGPVGKVYYNLLQAMLGKGKSPSVVQRLVQVLARRIKDAQTANTEYDAAAPDLLPGQTGKRSYKLGPVKSWVGQAAQYLGNMFNLPTIYGWSSTGSVATSDHPKGLALDLMTNNLGKPVSVNPMGDRISKFVEGHAKALNIKYQIWNRRIWENGKWRGYTGPRDHKDHVHLSFTADGKPLKLNPNLPGLPGGADTVKLPGGFVAVDKNSRKGQENNKKQAYNQAISSQATTKQLLSMFMTGAQESYFFKNLANSTVPKSLKLPHDKVAHDHDSVGIMQQRVGRDGKGAGWGTVEQAMNPYHAAAAFLSAAKRKDKKGLTAAALAQKVQVSAKPSAYGQHRAWAIKQLKAYNPKFKDSDFKGFAEGGSVGYAFLAPSAFAAGGNVGQADLPSRGLGSAARAVQSSNSAGGFNVQNLNVNNPLPERAGDSIYRQVDKLKTIYR